MSYELRVKSDELWAIFRVANQA